MEMMPDVLIFSKEESFARMLVLELQEQGYTARILRTKHLHNFMGENHSVSLLMIDFDCFDGVESFQTFFPSTSELPLFCFSYEKPFFFNQIEEAYPGKITWYMRPFSVKKWREDVQKILKQKKDAVSPPFPKESKKTLADEFILTESLPFVWFRNEKVGLTKMEHQLLYYLLHHHGTTVSRKEIYHQLWKREDFGSTNVVDVYIRYLRNKLDDHFQIKLIYTVRGKGYMIK